MEAHLSLYTSPREDGQYRYYFRLVINIAGVVFKEIMLFSSAECLRPAPRDNNPMVTFILESATKYSSIKFVTIVCPSR